ncbi:MULTISPECIES: hypothetical protein [Microbacterium]|uniref:hypothetical protein n=1 Tax=Microbacterium TaxID=33882 RepID=UPI000CFA9B6F|nr:MULTISPECIES: hypothetical protein [unclassified Microbacterium]PRB05510.1 hypothetical protein CQ047_15820 [Microbacterium sp. MYb72]
MRVNKWGVGVVLAAAVMLTGCSAGATDKPADAKPSASASQEAEAPTTGCPELTEGAKIDGAALGGCIADATSSIAGYAATSTVMGMETTGRYNPSEKALESTTPMGSVIVIGSDAWVKSATGAWQVADSTSSDPIIAGLSMGATAAAASSPTAIATLLAGDFTVTGTGERLGQKVFLVSGTIETQGVASSIVLELTKDFAPLATTGTADVSGQSIESVTVVTEWDVKQDIVAPL